MGWKHFVWTSATIIVILILAPLTILPFSHDLAKEVRDWIGAYSGVFLIIAALIAAYPVFMQLEDSKIATNRTRVEMIAGIQSALSNENERVESVSKIVDDIIQFAMVKQHASINSARKTCLKNITDVKNEIGAKVDKIPRVSEERVNFVRATHEFCKHLEPDISADPGEFYFTSVVKAGNELQKAAESYKKANHEYRESLTQQTKKFEFQIFPHDDEIRPLGPHFKFLFWRR
jgi:hypothetical protein